MMYRALFFLSVLLVVVTLLSCSRKKSDADQEEARRNKEMDLFVSAIRTVQERYVDVDRVQLHDLMSNSLRGMVENIDPYARIYYSTNTISDEIPPDASMVEITCPDPHGIMIIQVYGFNAMMKKQLRRLESEFGQNSPSGILIDPRDAYGDDYTAALALMEWLLPKETVAGILLEKQGNVRDPLTTRRSPLWKNNRVVVLTDHQLSGPAEFLASALHYHQRAVLVGETTKGLAVIQSTLRLTDEWNVQLSTGRILDPAGEEITGRPLTPDILVETDPGDGENVDWILNRGVSVLRNPEDSPN